MGKPTKLNDPIGIVGGYSLHLYCQYNNERHDWREFPHEFYGPENGSEARAKAKVRGWKFDFRKNVATCPKCVKDLGL